MQSPWFLPVATAATTCCIAVVAALYVNERNKVAKIQRFLYTCWERYIGALAESLPGLRSFRAALARVHSDPAAKELTAICEKLYATVREEIIGIEAQLDALSKTPDDQWHTMPIHWRAAMDLHQDVSRLIQLVQTGIPREQLAELQIEWTQECQLKYDEESNGFRRTIADLEREVEELKRRMLELEALLEKLKAEAEKEPEVKEDSPAPAPVAEVDEEEIAARFLATLGDNLPEDKVEVECAKTDGEIFYCNNQLLEDQEPARRASLESHLAWMEQVRRWWRSQRMIRKHARLLDELTGKMESDGDDEEVVRDFQEAEAQTAEMRQRVRSLTTANRNLAKQLEGMDLEKSTVEQLKFTLNQMEISRKNTMREMQNLEAMMERQDKEITRLRAQGKKIGKLEKDLDKAQYDLRDKGRLVDELQDDLTKLASEADKEVAKLKAELEDMKQMMAAGQVAGMVPEAEVLELQTQYDELHVQMQQAKSSKVQAERSTLKAEEELAKLKHSNQDLTQKYRDLRDELTALKMEKGL